MVNQTLCHRIRPSTKVIEMAFAENFLRLTVTSRYQKKTKKKQKKTRVLKKREFPYPFFSINKL